MGRPRAPSNGAPRLRGGEGRAACAAVARETVMAPGSILTAQHSPEFLETDIVPVSLLDGRPTPAISCGARRARTLRAPFRVDVGRSRDSKVRDRPTRQPPRVVR